MTVPTPTLPGLESTAAQRWRAGIEAEVRRGHRARTRAIALSGSAVLAGGATAVALVLASPGVSYAFGGWSATPTAKTAAESFASSDPCLSFPIDLGGVGGHVTAIVDTRGPFTLGYYVASSASGSATLTCVTGPAFTHPAVAMSRGDSAMPSAPAGQVDYQTAIPGSVDGQGYTIVTGSAGSGVTGVTFELSDGSAVAATVGDGLLVAWWPGDATVVSSQVAAG